VVEEGWYEAEAVGASCNCFVAYHDWTILMKECARLLSRQDGNFNV